MKKYICNYGRTIFTLEPAPIRNDKGELDTGKMLERVKEIVGKDCHVQPA